MSTSPWSSAPVQPDPSLAPATGPRATDPVARVPEVVVAPRGPNWALAITSVVLLGVSGAIGWHLLGLPALALAQLGPSALVITGLAFVLIGQLGLLRRRRRQRRRRVD